MPSKPKPNIGSLIPDIMDNYKVRDFGDEMFSSENPTRTMLLPPMAISRMAVANAVRMGGRTYFITPEIDHDEMLRRLTSMDHLTKAELGYTDKPYKPDQLSGDKWWDEIKRRAVDRHGRTHRQIVQDMFDHEIMPRAKSRTLSMLASIPRQTGKATRTDIVKSLLDQQLMERRANKAAWKWFKDKFDWDIPVIGSGWSKTENGMSSVDKAFSINLPGKSVTIFKPNNTHSRLKEITDRAVGVNPNAPHTKLKTKNMDKKHGF